MRFLGTGSSEVRAGAGCAGVRLEASLRALQLQPCTPLSAAWSAATFLGSGRSSQGFVGSSDPSTHSVAVLRGGCKNVPRMIAARSGQLVQLCRMRLDCA